MKERSVIIYLSLLILLFVSGSMAGCAQRTFDESIITEGDRDPLWRAYAARGQAFDNCVKTASVRKAAPMPATRPAPRPVARATPAPKPAMPAPTPAPTAPGPVEKTAVVRAPGMEMILSQDAECPPGCVPISRVNPAVVVPLTQGVSVAPATPAVPGATQALPEMPSLPATPPPAVPPAAPVSESPQGTQSPLTTPVPPPSSPATAPALSPEATSGLGQAVQVETPSASSSASVPVVPVPTAAEIPGAPAETPAHVPLPAAAGSLGGLVPAITAP